MSGAPPVPPREATRQHSRCQRGAGHNLWLRLGVIAGGAAGARPPVGVGRSPPSVKARVLALWARGPRGRLSKAWAKPRVQPPELMRMQTRGQGDLADVTEGGPSSQIRGGRLAKEPLMAGQTCPAVGKQQEQTLGDRRCGHWLGATGDPGGL